MEAVFGHLCLCLGGGKWTVTLRSKPASCVLVLPGSRRLSLARELVLSAPSCFSPWPAGPSPLLLPHIQTWLCPAPQHPKQRGAAGADTHSLPAAGISATLMHSPHPGLKSPAPYLPYATGQAPASSSLPIPYMWHPRAVHPTMTRAGARGDRVRGDATRIGSCPWLGNPRRVFRGTVLRGRHGAAGSGWVLPLQGLTLGDQGSASRPFAPCSIIYLPATFASGRGPWGDARRAGGAPQRPSPLAAPFPTGPAPLWPLYLLRAPLWWVPAQGWEGSPVPPGGGGGVGRGQAGALPDVGKERRGDARRSLASPSPRSTQEAPGTPSRGGPRRGHRAGGEPGGSASPAGAG